MIFDFHTHSFLSDGINSPIELIRCADAAGYKCIALTDHASYSNIDFIIESLARDCQLAGKYWDIMAIPGIEITNVPAKSINDMAAYAKQKGAKIVVVHGQTIVENVEEKTNWEAVNSPHVDLLAHPGLITAAEAEAAAKNMVFLEISARKGHSLGNGRTVMEGRKAQARFLINTDSHSHLDLFKPDFLNQVGLGAGLSVEEIEEITRVNTSMMLKKLGINS
ncbi:MAG: histidinol phosphate phosphatase domain-containing protein [Actinomycetota bacterium]|jgi:histidinol phosphatase-like PHP family hydrolase|nr:histidinol phosphate phosphatase domain-containing protein [Actinomycetota bacterium]